MNDKELYMKKGVFSLEYDKETLRDMVLELQSNWNSLREYIINVIDGAREELNTIMQGENLEYINQCSREFEVIRKNLEMILDKMNELESSDKN